jgi:hypothetical protein
MPKGIRMKSAMRMPIAKPFASGERPGGTATNRVSQSSSFMVPSELRDTVYRYNGGYRLDNPCRANDRASQSQMVHARIHRALNGGKKGIASCPRAAWAKRLVMPLANGNRWPFISKMERSRLTITWSRTRSGYSAGQKELAVFRRCRRRAPRRRTLHYRGVLPPSRRRTQRLPARYPHTPA